MSKLTKKDLEAIIKENYKKIYNLGLRLFNYNFQDAEDFTQEVFEQFYKNYKKFEGKSQISTWIYSIGLNLGLNLFRKNKKIKALYEEKNNYEEIYIEDQSPELKFLKQLDERIIKNKILEELVKLPDEYRLPLILFYYEKISYKEMSEKLHIPEGTLKSLVYRGKLILREKIKELKDYLYE